MKMRRALLLQIKLQLPVLLLLLLMPNICWQNIVTAANLRSQESNGNLQGTLFRQFPTATVIRPQVTHGRTKRSLQSTQDDATDGLHAAHITLNYTHNGKSVDVDLQRNDLLLPARHFLRYQNGNSHVMRENFTKPELDLCYYQGRIRGRKDSRVALSTCNGGFNGVVFDGSESYSIYPYADGSGGLLDDHYLLSEVNRREQNITCGYNQHTNVVREEKDSYHIYNANKNSSYVELVLVVDNKVFSFWNNSTKIVHQHCKEIANIVNALYEPLNIFVSLVGVVIWNEHDEIQLTSQANETLHNFKNYQRKLGLEHPIDNMQLITNVITDCEGMAYVGTMCSKEYSAGINKQYDKEEPLNVAELIAHEMGHNFGISDASNVCKCKNCLMTAPFNAWRWGNCSINALKKALSQENSNCLHNIPEKLFDSRTCDNGVVEDDI